MFPRRVRLVLITFALPLLADAQVLQKPADSNVVRFIKENYHPLDIVYRLAPDHSIVLLNGGGFEAPDWSVRISFANLPADAYENIGRALRAVARSYVEAYRFATSNGRKTHRR
jgi:aspartate 4-decarboxylase